LLDVAATLGWMRHIPPTGHNLTNGERLPSCRQSRW
jgi:hypothetical protein